MSFMILILEDRAIYNMEMLLQKIKSSDLWEKPAVRDICKRLLNKNKNYRKSGAIGKYQYRRNQMLTQEEQEELANVCEIYDDVVRIQDRIIRKLARQHLIDKSNVDEKYHSIIADIVMCIVCSEMVEMYYIENQRKKDYIKICFRCHEMSPGPFTLAVALLDNLAFTIMGQKFEFTNDPEFDKAYIAYINTIMNNKRMMKHYKDLGIKDSLNVTIDGHPESKLIVQYNNISN